MSRIVRAQRMNVCTDADLARLADGIGFPALAGEPVTEAHARRCVREGHATHTVNGADTGVCPRCGEVTRPVTVRLVKETVCPSCGWAHDGATGIRCDRCS